MALKKSLLTTAILAATLGLTACGGSSSNSNDNDDNNTTHLQRKLMLHLRSL